MLETPSDVATTGQSLAENGILLLVMETAFLLVTLMLLSFLALFAAGYVRTFIRSRLDRRLASNRLKARTGNTMPLRGAAP